MINGQEEERGQGTAGQRDRETRGIED